MKIYWDLERDGITQSGLKLFLRCPEQFRLAYVEGWTPKGTSPALLFGSAVHDLLETCNSQSQIYNAVEVMYRREKRISITQDNKLFLTFRLAAMMVHHYFDFWSNTDHVWEEKERVFKVQHPTGVFLTGKKDGVLSGPTLFETKTTASIDEDKTRKILPYDFQSMFYSVAHELDGDVPLVSILKNVIKRPTNRQKKTEDLEEFILRIEEGVEELPAEFFMRWKLDLKPDWLERWDIECLSPALNRLKQWWQHFDRQNPPDNPYHYRNDDALEDGWGTCSLFDLMVLGNRYLYRKKKVPFPELETPKEEKHGKSKKTAGDECSKTKKAVRDKRKGAKSKSR